MFAPVPPSTAETAGCNRPDQRAHYKDDRQQPRHDIDAEFDQPLDLTTVEIDVDQQFHDKLVSGRPLSSPPIMGRDGSLGKRRDRDARVSRGATSLQRRSAPC